MSILRNSLLAFFLLMLISSCEDDDTLLIDNEGIAIPENNILGDWQLKKISGGPID